MTAVAPAPGDLTVIHIVEPPEYQIMACTLRASLRLHVPPGVLRGTSLPEDRHIFTVHHRNRRNLRDAGLKKRVQAMLTETLGVRYIRRLTPDAPQTAEADER